MFEKQLADRDAREGRTYTVRALDADDFFQGTVLAEHVSLDTAMDLYEAAWTEIPEGASHAVGATVFDDVDGLPACLAGVELGCSCPRCSPKDWETEPCPPTTPTGQAPPPRGHLALHLALARAS